MEAGHTSSIRADGNRQIGADRWASSKVRSVRINLRVVSLTQIVAIVVSLALLNADRLGQNHWRHN